MCDEPSEPQLSVDLLSYSDLVLLVGHLNFENSSFSPEHQQGRLLPSDLCRNVSSFLFVPPVRHQDVRVTAASSTSGRHMLEGVLLPTKSGGWMSAVGTMPNGRGREYLQFRLDLTGQVRRLRTLSILIPGMVRGPCSLWEFQIEFLPQSPQVWKSLPDKFALTNEKEFQTFTFEQPIDALEVRIVCLSSQINRWLFRDERTTNRYNQVGFSAVKFE